MTEALTVQKGRVVYSRTVSETYLKFIIRLEDGSELPYGCDMNNPFGNTRLARLCLACHKPTISDTEELHAIDFTVTHTATVIRRLDPLPVVRKPTLWERLRNGFLH